MQPNWFVAIEAVAEQPLSFPPLVEGMRLLHPADYHVTIAFFGQLPFDPSDRIAGLLSQIRSGRFCAVATEALLLPRRDYASVVALGFGEGSDTLRSVITQWRDRLRGALDLDPEQRPVLPHLTVARMKPRRDHCAIQERSRWAAALAGELPITFSFRRIGLYTWQNERKPNHPQYRATRWVELE
ncbi:RNA 2',3'-cyclic phosphodiesterase [bacterium HR20]|nr:RNA 2',3'-cyclic phosphodiesterase [bacterium HR20]